MPSISISRYLLNALLFICTLFLLFIPLVAVHALMARKSIQERMVGLPDSVCAVIFGVWVFFILLLYPVDYRPFIYFQF